MHSPFGSGVNLTVLEHLLPREDARVHIETSISTAHMRPSKEPEHRCPAIVALAQRALGLAQAVADRGATPISRTG